MTFLVDGDETTFEACDLGEGIWAAIGQIAGVDVTIDSRGVPQNDVQLERLAPGQPLIPKMPDLAESLPAVAAGLEARFAAVPFRRVRRWADYWALTDIERDHVDRVSAKYGLSESQRERLQAHWLGRLDAELSATLDQLRQRRNRGLPHRRMARWLRWNWLYQLWSNTLGPGARTWFGNRLATMRPYTFRLRWRP